MMDDYLEFRPKEGGDDAVVGVSRRNMLCVPLAGDFTSSLPAFFLHFVASLVLGVLPCSRFTLHLDNNPPEFPCYILLLSFG